MGRIGVEPSGDIIPRRKPADFPLVLVYVKRVANRLEEVKQTCRRSATLLLVRLPTVPLLAPTEYRRGVLLVGCTACREVR